MLARAGELGRAQPETDHARHLATELVRRRNQVAHHLRAALAAGDLAGALLRSP
jgi:hypothetical protein